MMNNMWTAALYGNQVTRKFSDVFPSVENFFEEWENGGISTIANELEYTFREEDIKLTYYLLYAKYGNSHIASFDENQFKYKLWAIIFQHGGAWAKKIELQNELRKLPLEEIGKYKAIYNHSFNPSTEPSTATLEELTTINEQNTTTSKRAKGDSYALFMSLLSTNYNDEYINRFRKLFLTFVEPALPLWYTEGD